MILPKMKQSRPCLIEGGPLTKKPVPVEVVETLSANEIAQGILGPLISPLASAAMVIVFVIFMLLKARRSAQSSDPFDRR